MRPNLHRTKNLASHKRRDDDFKERNREISTIKIDRSLEKLNNKIDTNHKLLNKDLEGYFF